MSTSATEAATRLMLEGMVERAIGGDVLTEKDGGFLAVMSKGSSMVRQDIPAAFEMCGLLHHYLAKYPVQQANFESADVLLSPSVQYDPGRKAVVLLMQIEAETLQYVACAIADNLRSDKVKAMPGVLAIPFAIETFEGEQFLLPEWFVAFYVDGNEDQCVPLLTGRSVTDDQRFGDWVNIAVERMAVFGLPRSAAQEAMRRTARRE